ncbi:MAG: ABC transporter ATP-binding protein [Phycisphaeraceae bacterium]|nr:ABC transporter ATP-binding protein [Phycisphaeraceae bacterium]MCB9847309.1 ABC transporter ATP-binding protein [Phycisphaeraceae bacterium]
MRWRRRRWRTMATKASSAHPVVAAQGLTKVFKDFWMRSRVRAVDALDLEVHPHEVFGLLGPNGSGKSTTIKMILGLLHKSSGRLAVFGKPTSDVAIKRRIGVLPEESYLYPFLNARETLDYYAKLFQLDHRVRTKRIDELLDMVGLSAVQHRQIREYSKGMQRRIGLAQALINDPEFLILDEPTTGLDPIGTRQVKDLIIELGRRGKTILLSSHQLSDVEDVVDRLAILYGGKKRAEGSVDELLEARDRMTIETDALDDDLVSEIDQLIVRRTGHAIRRVARPRQRLDELFVGIVEQAQAERLVTHGAAAGGATAAFLRGDGDDAVETGEALIESLVRQSEPAPSVRGRDETSPPAAAAEPAQDRSIIEDLVSGEEPPAAPQPAAAPAPAGGGDVEVSGDVDLGMIGSLLGDTDDGDGDDSGNDKGRKA